MEVLFTSFGRQALRLSDGVTIKNAKILAVFR